MSKVKVIKVQRVSEEESISAEHQGPWASRYLFDITSKMYMQIQRK